MKYDYLIVGTGFFAATHPDEAKRIIEEQSSDITDPKNLEEQAIKLIEK